MEEGDGSYVTQSECTKMVSTIKESLGEVKQELRDIKVTLTGPEGRSGIVADLNELKQRSRYFSGVIEIIKSVAISIVIVLLTRVLNV